MANKTFTSGTVIDSPWLNDVNRVAYSFLGDGANAATTKTEARSFLGVGSVISFRNKLINASGNVNQRGYPSGVIAPSGSFYFTDRWRLVVANTAATWTTLANGCKEWTAPATGVEQIVEGNNVESGIYVLSWVGTAQGYLNNSPVPNGGTILVPYGQPVGIKFASGTFSQPQFERGERPTPFEFRPLSYEMDLAQRYFYSLDGNGLYCLGQVQSPTYVAAILNLPTTMRTNPSFVANNIGCTNSGGGGVPASSASIASGNPRVVGMSIGFGAGSGLVAGNSTILYGILANSFLRFDAEL